MSIFLPKGPYLNSVACISVDLFCMARKRNGLLIPASICITHLTKGILQNKDGHLVHWEGEFSHAGFIPGGPYHTSVQDIRVILSAVCTTHNLRLQWSTLDITHLSLETSILNQNGVLLPQN